jgi:hypothetical protein
MESARLGSSAESRCKEWLRIERKEQGVQDNYGFSTDQILSRERIPQNTRNVNLIIRKGLQSSEIKQKINKKRGRSEDRPPFCGFELMF